MFSVPGCRLKYHEQGSGEREHATTGKGTDKTSGLSEESTEGSVSEKSQLVHRQGTTRDVAAVEGEIVFFVAFWFVLQFFGLFHIGICHFQIKEGLIVFDKLFAEFELR